MKAIIWTKYGTPEGLKLQEVAKPVPKENEVLVKIHAATVTAGDCEMRRLALPLMLSFPMRIYTGLLRPKRVRVLGQEVAGEVMEAGENVRSFKVGDQVFGTTGFSFGGYAEYICLPGEPKEMGGTLAIKPANISYAEAAAVPVAGFEALHFVRRANLQLGKKVLVIGAGGSIGTFSIQLAKHYGAEVTAVDSTDKLALLTSLGADHVIDYTKEDYTRKGQVYDLIIDVVGRKGVSDRLKLLADDGIYFLAFATLGNALLARWAAMTGGKQLKIESSSQKKEDLIILKELIETGVLKSVIGKSFPLAQTAEAHRFAESGGKQGNIAIIIGEK